MQCIGMTLFMISIVVQCNRIQSAMHCNYNADDKHSCAMYWDCIAYDEHSCAMYWDCIAYDTHSCAMQLKC